MRILRQIGAVLLGMICGGITVGLIEMINGMLYPQPAEVAGDPERLAQWIATLPVLAFLILLVAWSAGFFVGPYVARQTAADRSMIPCAIVWVVLVAATLANLVMLPHPWWVSLAAMVSAVVGGSGSYRDDREPKDSHGLSCWWHEMGQSVYSGCGGGRDCLRAEYAGDSTEPNRTRIYPHADQHDSGGRGK